MKKILLMILLVLIFSNFLHSRSPIRSTRFNYNFNVYIVHYDNYKLLKMEKMVVFASSFDKNLNKLCKQFNTRIPVNLKVNIAIGAWVFKSLTGKGSHMGGLFDPNREVFYFQNPEALKREGIDQRIINHEIMHYVLYKNRKSSGDYSNDWLEESFCETMFPSSNYSSMFIDNPIKNIASYDQLKYYITKSTVSANQKVRQKGYFAAYLWGTFLFKKFSKKYFFRVSTGNVDDSKIKEAFILFKKKYND